MAWAEEPVLVRVPATSANLGPGFDALGLALSLYDDLAVRVAPSGLSIEVSGEGAADVADAGEKHLVVRAMRATFDELGAGQPPGIAVRCVNRIPHGRGLGSSAAAIVAGVLAARALAGARLDPGEALPLANELEGHPDNVAPCLYGGLTIAWLAPSRGDSGGSSPPGGHGGRAAPHTRGDSGGSSPPAGHGGRAAPHTRGDSGGSSPRASTVHAVKLEPAEQITPVAIIAPAPVSTEIARGLLPELVPHSDAARNAGRAALLIAAFTARPDALLDATEDRLHQDYRAPAMPATHALVGRLREAGLPAVVSGAGPSVLALLTSGHGLETLDSIVKETGIEWRVSPLDVERQGGSVAPGVPSAW